MNKQTQPLQFQPPRTSGMSSVMTRHLLLHYRHRHGANDLDFDAVDAWLEFNVVDCCCFRWVSLSLEVGVGLCVGLGELIGRTHAGWSGNSGCWRRC